MLEFHARLEKSFSVLFQSRITLIHPEIDSSNFPIIMKLWGDTSHAIRRIRRRLYLFKESVINHLRPAALISFPLRSYDSPVRASDSLALMRQLFTPPFYLPQPFVFPFFDFLLFDYSPACVSLEHANISFFSHCRISRTAEQMRMVAFRRAEANNFHKFQQEHKQKSLERTCVLFRKYLFLPMIYFLIFTITVIYNSSLFVAK